MKVFSIEGINFNIMMQCCSRNQYISNKRLMAKTIFIHQINKNSRYVFIDRKNGKFIKVLVDQWKFPLIQGTEVELTNCNRTDTQVINFNFKTSFFNFLIVFKKGL